MQAYTEQLIHAAYMEHRGSLVRHLAVVTRDADAAQDLAHEAFIRLAREIEAGRAPDDTAAWLHRVGRNLATSRGRHMQVARRHAETLSPPAEPTSPSEVVITGELNEAVQRELARLSTSERHALVLAAYGFDGGEIASSIGRTPGATRTLLCRARAKLRERLLIAQGAPA